MNTNRCERHYSTTLQLSPPNFTVLDFSTKYVSLTVLIDTGNLHPDSHTHRTHGALTAQAPNTYHLLQTESVAAQEMFQLSHEDVELSH
jgi:hypothetical protein